MKQCHIIASVPVVAGKESIRHNYIAGVPNVPVWGLNGLSLLRPVSRYSGSLNKKSISDCCLLLIKRYLCGAKVHIQALHESRLNDNRKHKQFYYNPLHISLMYVDFGEFGLYRTAFFCIIHLIAKVQMKHLSLTTGAALVLVPVKVGSFPVWRTIVIVFNTLLDKVYSFLKACSMPAVCLFVMFVTSLFLVPVYCLMMKGGAQ